MFGLGEGFDILEVEAGEVGLADAGVADAEVIVDGGVKAEGGDGAGDAACAVGGLTGEDFDPAQRVLEGGDLGGVVDGELDGGAGFGESGLVGRLRGGEGVGEVVGGEDAVGIEAADLAVEGDRFVELAELFMVGGEGGENFGAVEGGEGLEGRESVGEIVLTGLRCGEEDAEGGRRVGILLKLGGEEVADFGGVSGALQIVECLVALDEGEGERAAGFVEDVEKINDRGGPAGFEEALREGEGAKTSGGGVGRGGEFGKEGLNVSGEDVGVVGDGGDGGFLLFRSECGEGGVEGGRHGGGEECVDAGIGNARKQPDGRTRVNGGRIGKRAGGGGGVIGFILQELDET